MSNRLRYSAPDQVFGQHRSFTPRDEDPTFFSTDPDPGPAEKKFWIRTRLRIRPEIDRNEEKNIFIF